MKAVRHEAIIRLIEQHCLSTQTDLLEMLKAEGFDTTQATISRDIRELKISKVLGTGGKYHYAMPRSNDSVHKSTFKNAYATAIISIDNVGNIIVVKTHPGLAQAVAAGIDAMHISGILGCVAGDDTIITVARDAEIATQSIYKLKEEMSGK